ncbi:MAG: O-antigen ligase family protein, partial [bacterium]
ISLFVSVIVSIWSLADWQARLFGPLGNPGFLACYLLFHIFFALYLILKDKNIYWRISYILILIFNFIVLYFTSTRGAYYGLFAGLLLFAFLFILKKSKKIGIVLLAIFILIGSLGVYWQRDRFLKTEEARMVSWRISWSAFKERPILGWGPENYILAFAKHYDPNWPITEWFDKAHSNFWEFSVTTGALGLLSYLSLFIVSGFSPILIAYFIMQLFWIDTTVTLMLFFITLALCEKKFFNLFREKKQTKN